MNGIAVRLSVVGDALGAIFHCQYGAFYFALWTIRRDGRLYGEDEDEYKQQILHEVQCLPLVGVLFTQGLSLSKCNSLFWECQPVTATIFKDFICMNLIGIFAFAKNFLTHIQYSKENQFCKIVD